MGLRRIKLLAAVALTALLIPVGAPAASCPPANGARNCCCCCVCACEPCGADDAEMEDPAPEDGGQEQADYSSTDLRFNELFPNPVGTDSENEFIELTNAGTAAASLAGWEIRDDKGRSFAFGDTTVAGGAELAVPYPETRIPLPNGGGKLTLHDPNGTERDAIEYGTPVPEGSTYASFNSGWSWTTTPTPDADNILTTPEDEDEDAPEEEIPAEEIPEEETTDEPEPVMVSLSEVMPNPAGDDAEGEWIELYNAGVDANLAGWILDDVDGGSNPYAFPEGTVVAAGGYLTIPRPSSKLALNNDEDSVRLFAPDGTLADSIDYADAKEGEAFARGTEGWSWTTEPTPGAENSFPAEETGATAGGEDEVAEDAPEEDAVPETIPVEAAHDLPDGTEVTVIGVVTLPPGVIGKTVFGLQDTDTDYGTTVRVYGDTIPGLAEGDLITVTGKIMRKTNGELRINSSADGIEVLGGGEVAEKEKDIAELDSGAAGLAVSIEGIVADIGRGWFIITDESASHEIKVELPEGQTYDFESGDRVTVSGVIRTESSALALTVLGTEDIVAAPIPDDEAGETAEGDSSQTLAAETEDVTGLLPFLTVGAIGAGGVAYRGLRGRNDGNGRKKRKG